MKGKMTAMSPALQTITDIYASMEQGNIGKLLTILDDSVLVYTAQCMGGNRRGREGILQLISLFYRPGSRAPKTAGHYMEQGNTVIVLGDIRMRDWESIDSPMSFADIWVFDNNRIISVVFYYRDPELLCEYLSRQ
jgi:ketosteroid isomerase-like protein